jgi:two-component system CheB/CheR fusion protein
MATKKSRRMQPTPARTRPRAKPATPLTIAGVGASAGGLEAFSALLDGLPPQPGLAIVFVQHLAPHHDSALPTLLAGHTAMPVIQVTSGVRIKSDHVYVIPPNVQMELLDGTLALSPRPDDRTQHTPIDTFFSSLARVTGGRAIAVVLSGTASDGATGIRDVKAAGGITIAQEPKSANYDGMPKAAIATGMVDLVLPAAKIGAELVSIAAHPYAAAKAAGRDDKDASDEQLKQIFELLRPVSGVDFRHYKQPTIRRRLIRRMVLHRLTSVDQYVDLLKSDPIEVRQLFHDLLIHVTRFFREPDSFEHLAAAAFPALLEDRGADHTIRIWICGCATGEEAYSLAIALVEFLQRERSDARVQIFATDVSETAIDHARAGLYPGSIAEDVGPERLRRFFTSTDGHYRVSKQIRDLCVFARQDITKDPPFSRLDLILCRNVLIYLDAPLQKKLIGMFHYALNAGGYLMLGQAETVGGQGELFTVVDKKHRIHRKKDPLSGIAAPAFPVEYLATAPPRRRAREAAAADHGLQAEVSRVILDRYAPAGVVVDSDMQILQFRGQTGAFLEPSPGEASLNLLKMVREGLLYGLRTALHSARKTKQPVRKDGLQVRAGNTWRAVAIEVVPLMLAGRMHYLVTFDDRQGREPQRASSADRRKGDRRPPADTGKAALLQRELAANREYLQSIIQELEAANEELQSANEEVLSSNEELQSTNEELDTAKEELQSTNEELNTVNEELQGRNDELSRVNGDLVNLIASVQIAIVIVGSDLRIRRFTPMAEKVLNLIPADLERSISHIKPNIDCPNLDQLIVECMETVSLIERDVQDRQGRWYALRIRPYKSLDKKIDGAVVALFDVDLMKRSEQRAELAREFAETVMIDTPHPMAVLASDLRVRYVNPSFARLFALAPEDIKGRMLADLGGPSWNLEPWSHSIDAKPGTNLPSLTIAPDGAGRWRHGLRVNGRLAPSPEGEPKAILVSITEGVAITRERE